MDVGRHEDLRDNQLSMKPLPAPDVPGNTEAERMDNAVRRIFSVSKTNWRSAKRSEAGKAPQETR
jgi:hypothetical protein